MARPAPVPAGGAGPDPDILTAEELAARLGLHVHTVRDLSAAEDAGGPPADAAAVVLGGYRVGSRRRYRWSQIYEQIAGPGIPDGDICDPGELSRRLSVPRRTVQRSLGPPGTPGKLPGRKIGDQWRSAWPAVEQQIRDPAGQQGSPAPR